MAISRQPIELASFLVRSRRKRPDPTWSSKSDAFWIAEKAPSKSAMREPLLLSKPPGPRRMRERLQGWFPGAVRASFPLALAAGMFASAHASAQEYRTRDIGGWTVAASSDKRGCFITMEYEGDGETTLLLGLNVDGTNHLSVLNDNWSIKQKDRLKLNFRLSNGRYSNHAAIGIASKGKKGFVTDFEAKFPTYFAASKFLHIYRGDVPVDQLSLVGSSAAVAELRRCVSIFKGEPAGRASGKARSARIPKDPFAPDP